MHPIRDTQKKERVAYGVCTDREMMRDSPPAAICNHNGRLAIMMMAAPKERSRAYMDNLTSA
jgi:hypothetical protein